MAATKICETAKKETKQSKTKKRRSLKILFELDKILHNRHLPENVLEYLE